MPKFNLQQATDGRAGRWFAWFRSWHCRAFLGILAVGINLACGNFKAAGQEQMPAEFQVKAAFLINFPKYVDWPADAFAQTNSPLIVAIYGDEDVANEARSMVVNGRTVSGRSIVVKRIAREDEINRDCHILFVGASERQRIQAILEKIRGAKILTVGESEDFLDKDGMINLARQGRKIRLQVNLIAARNAQLKISSRLLVAADVVKGKSN